MDSVDSSAALAPQEPLDGSHPRDLAKAADDHAAFAPVDVASTAAESVEDSSLITPGKKDSHASTTSAAGSAGVTGVNTVSSSPVAPDLPTAALTALFLFMHGFPACAVKDAATAFVESDTFSELKVKLSKSAVERNLKLCCKVKQLPPPQGSKAKGQPKVWAVEDHAWSFANMQPAQLVAKDVPKPSKPAKPRACDLEVTASSPAAGTGTGGMEGAVAVGVQVEALPAPVPAPAADEQVAPASAVPAPVAVPAAAAPVEEVAAPPQPDPRAGKYMDIVRHTSQVALKEHCGWVVSASGALERTTVLGPYASEPHCHSLLFSLHADLVKDRCVREVYPDGHAAALAFLCQGSSAPLSVLVEAMTPLLNPSGATLLPSSVISERLKLLAERTAHGVRPTKGTNTWEEDSMQECLWRWEVENIDLHLIVPDVLQSEEKEAETVAADSGESGAATGAGAGVSEAKASKVSKAARRVVTAVKEDRQAFKLLANEVCAAQRLVDLLTPPPASSKSGKGSSKGTWAVEEGKVTEAMDKMDKAARALAAYREKEKAEIARLAKLREEKDKKERERAAAAEAKEKERAAAAEAKERERAAAAEAKEREKRLQLEAEEAKKRAEKEKNTTFWNRFAKPAASTAGPAAPSGVAKPSAPAPPTKDSLPKPADVPASLSHEQTRFCFRQWTERAQQHRRERCRLARVRARAVPAARWHAGRGSGASAAEGEVIDLSSDAKGPLVLRYKALHFHGDERPDYWGSWALSRARARVEKARRGEVDEAQGGGAGQEGEEDQNWDPRLESGVAPVAGPAGGVGAGGAAPSSALEAAEEEKAYIDVTGRPPLSTRQPWGVAPDTFLYEVDSEGEWEAGGDGDSEGTDLEAEGALDDEEDEEEEGEGGEDGAKAGEKRKREDALDYEDGWLCPDDHIERAAPAASALDPLGDDPLASSRPPAGDDSDVLSDGEVDKSSAAYNPAAMPGASTTLLAKYGGEGSGAATAPMAKRRIVMPTNPGICDIRDFTFGLTYDMIGHLDGLKQTGGDLAKAAQDLVAGKVEVLAGDAIVLQAPKMCIWAEGEAVDCDAAGAAPGASDNGGVGSEGKEGGESGDNVPAEGDQGETSSKKKSKAPKEPKPPKVKPAKPTFPEALLPLLVSMAHGSDASVQDITQAWCAHEQVKAWYTEQGLMVTSAAAEAEALAQPEAAEAVPQPPADSTGSPPALPAYAAKVCREKLGEITNKGKWGLPPPKPSSATVAACQMPDPVVAGSGESETPVLARGLAVSAPKREVAAAVHVDLDVWIRAVMNAKGSSALPEHYKKQRHVVHASVLSAVAWSLPEALEQAASTLQAFVIEKMTRLGKTPESMLQIFPNYSQAVSVLQAKGTLTGTAAPLTPAPSAVVNAVVVAPSAGKKRAAADTKPAAAKRAKKEVSPGSVAITSLLGSKPASPTQPSSDAPAAAAVGGEGDAAANETA